ncbi:MAG: transcriptional repressor LexA [Chloroflexota bacterium]|nr:transcriptional repressor LexA [Chloroflexota bacterium]
MRDKTKLSEKQRNILRFMELYVDQHGFPPTIREIGNAISIQSTSVVNYNLNKLTAGGYIIREPQAARGLRLTEKALAHRKPVMAASRVTMIPIVGQIVAGNPLPIPDDIAGAFADEPIEATAAMLHGTDPSEVFALKVKGDSMIDALINEGDIVLFRRASTANNGQMVAAWLPDRNETTLKHFYREGDNVRLQPAHPTYPAIIVSAANCQIQGCVLAVLRMSV